MRPNQTPAEFLAGLGLDSVKALEQAELAAWIIKAGLRWPDGVTVAKVKLIREAVKEGFAWNGWQEWLDRAQVESYSVLERNLIAADLLPAERRKEDLYLRVPTEAAEWIFSGDSEKVERKEGFYLIRVGEVFPPLRRGKGRLLVRREGEEIEVA